MFVVRDASQRGHSRLLWGVLTLVSWKFALIAYLLIRNDAALGAWVRYCRTPSGQCGPMHYDSPGTDEDKPLDDLPKMTPER